MRLRWRLLCLFIALSALWRMAHGQGYVVQRNVTTTVSINGTSVLRPVPGALVYVCAASQSICVSGNSVAVYPNANLATPLAQPIPADSLGNVLFYAPSGQFNYTAYTPALVPIKTYPFTVSGSGIGAQFPQSVNGILYATAFAGADIAAKVTAALTSLGGTSAHPIDRATVNLDGAAYTTSPITFPNETTAPYVRYVDFNCNGSTLTFTSSSAPGIHVLAQNNNGGAAAGAVHGCSFTTPTGAPAIQQDSRQALDIYNNIFYGGTTQLLVVNTMFQYGSVPGYNEQFRIHDNDFNGPSVAGIEISLNGGTDSAEYGNVSPSNHFQLPCGATAMQVDAGITIQGGELSGKVNTSQAACGTNVVSLIRNNGNIYRGTYGTWVGEDTAGSGGIYLFTGTGDTTLIDRDIIFTGQLNLKYPSTLYSHASLPYSIYATALGSDNCAKVDDESHGVGYVLSRKAIFAICQSGVRFFGGDVAVDANGSFDVYHFNNGTSPESATSLTSTLRVLPGVGTAIGPGFSMNPTGTCADAAGCLPFNSLNPLPANLVVSNVGRAAIVALSRDTTNNVASIAFGYWRPSGSYTELWHWGVDNAGSGGLDFYLRNATTGNLPLRFDSNDVPHFYKGVTCSGVPTSSYHVTDGVVDHC